MLMKTDVSIPLQAYPTVDKICDWLKMETKISQDSKVARMDLNR
jgi:hypothetical protein